MPKAKQLSLLPGPRKNTKLWWILNQGTYGGSMNYRKVRRPFSKKQLTHGVFKASIGPSLWFTHFDATIRTIAARTAHRYGVKISEVAVNRDHIHILFYTRSRESQTRFLRLFAATIGRKYKALKERYGLRQNRLWAARPFTRLVSWGRRSLMRTQAYIRRNHMEALGFIGYKPRRGHKLQIFLAVWESKISTA